MSETTPSRNRLTVWLVAVGAVAVLALSAVIYLLMRGEEKPAEAQSAETIRIVGYLTLGRGQFAWNKNPDRCWGHNGYDDLKVGAKVTITDPEGTVVAVGEIDSSDPWRNALDERYADSCRFHFEVRAPGGLKFYGIEIADRGVEQYTEEQINDGIDLTVG